MPDMREGGLGTAACYLTVERLALQAGVGKPLLDETSLLMGGCEELGTKSPSRPADCGLSSSDTAGAFLMMTDSADMPHPCSPM